VEKTRSRNVFQSISQRKNLQHGSVKNIDSQLHATRTCAVAAANAQVDILLKIHVLVLLVPVFPFISVHVPFRALCIIFYLYCICILRVTLCECHGGLKGYLLT